MKKLYPFILSLSLLSVPATNTLAQAEKSPAPASLLSGVYSGPMDFTAKNCDMLTGTSKVGMDYFVDQKGSNISVNLSDNLVLTGKLKSPSNRYFSITKAISGAVHTFSFENFKQDKKTKRYTAKITYVYQGKGVNRCFQKFVGVLDRTPPSEANVAEAKR